MSKLWPPYDAVSSRHVLEHTPDPRQTMRQQLALLREGGLLIAHTPDGSAAFRGAIESSRTSWGQSHPVLLAYRFVASVLASLPHMIASNDRPEKVATWDRISQEIRAFSKSGLFLAAKKIR